MDWNAAIEKNRGAPKRVLAALVAMMAMAHGTAAKTLSRRLHRAVRPTVSAVRRLIAIAARGIAFQVLLRPRCRARDRQINHSSRMIRQHRAPAC
jgi:hypothetical protein